MSFDNIIGQYRAKHILSRSLERERISHAYLFSGPEGVGKEALAIEFAKAIFCKSENYRPCDTCSSCRRVGSFKHPDFVYIFPSFGKNIEQEQEILASVTTNPYARLKPWATPSISIEQIRELRHMSTLKPLEGKRVVIIAEAEQMTVQAANALLKILEEPPPTMFLILTASKVNALLPTILSRCQEIRFAPLPDNQIEWALIEKNTISPENAKMLARMCQGSYGRALEWNSHNFRQQRETVIQFLRTCLKDPQSQLDLVEDLLRDYEKKEIKEIFFLMLIWFRDVLLISQNLSEVMEEYLVNIDVLDTLKKFFLAFESIDYTSVFQYLENSTNMIDRNVQVNLILIVLMINLKNAMKLKGHST